MRLPKPALLALLLLLLLIPLPVASHLEERDAFCIACHTAPEVAYFDRAQRARAEETPYADLASAHHGALGASFRCIDCHRGEHSLPDRALTLALGARDALVWLGGRADPTLEKGRALAPDLLDRACIRCHQEPLLEPGFNNHFHNRLPQAYRAWRAGPLSASQAGDPAPAGEQAFPPPAMTSLRCMDCHQAHRHLPLTEEQRYLDVDGAVLPACVRCHEEDGHGPLDLVR